MFKKLGVLVVIMIFTLSSAFVVQAANTTPAQLVKEARAAIKEVSVQDVKKMIDSKKKVIFLDIRNRLNMRKSICQVQYTCREGL